MKYIFTDFYTEFECIGGECSNTCCGKWDIEVDDATMQTYSKLEEPKRSWICSQIREEEKNGKKTNIIQLKEDGRCPFLNDCKLCDIYLQVSPDALSATCQNYPRKIVSYYDVVFATVMVSCPEVAGILLNKKEPIVFAYTEDDIKADTNGADWFLYNELINGLVVTTGILQKRSLAIRERVYLVLKLTDQVQRHMEEGQIGCLRENIECYKDTVWCEVQLQEMRSNMGRMPGLWSFVYEIMDGIENAASAAKVCKEWSDFLAKYKALESTAEEEYHQWSERFKEQEIETEFENLAVEFIFEYYMDALNGKNLFFNVLKMVLVLILVRACEVVHYNIFGKITKEDKIDIISLVSRVTENSGMLNVYAEELVKKNKSKQLCQLADYLD